MDKAVRRKVILSFACLICYLLLTSFLGWRLPLIIVLLVGMTTLITMILGRRKRRTNREISKDEAAARELIDSILARQDKGAGADGNEKR
jgi:uncharacterized membrane protein